MKKSILIIAFAAAMAVVQSGFALTVYDPTNHTENLAAKLEAIKQTAHQAEMVQNELKQLAKLNPAYQDETLAQIRSSISSINDIRNSIDAIGTDFNSMMDAFDEISPDYEDWNGVSAEQYARQMDRVRDAWDKAVNQSMLSGTVASPDEQQQTADAVTRLVEAAQGVTSAFNSGAASVNMGGSSGSAGASSGVSASGSPSGDASMGAASTGGRVSGSAGSAATAGTTATGASASGAAQASGSRATGAGSTASTAAGSGAQTAAGFANTSAAAGGSSAKASSAFAAGSMNTGSSTGSGAAHSGASAAFQRAIDETKQAVPPEATPQGGFSVPLPKDDD